MRHPRSRGGEAVIGLRLQHVLIVDGDLFLQRVQRRILIDLPPLAFQQAVAGLCRLPSIGFLVIRRRLFLVRGGTGAAGRL